MADPSRPDAPAEAAAKPARSASSEEDRALVRRALGEPGADGQPTARRDERAFERLVEKYRGPLTRHVAGMLRDPQATDDLVQEAFVKAFTALPSYSPDYAFSTWLYRIATNHTIDHIRRRRLKTVSIDKPIGTRDGEMQMELPDSTYRPDRAIVADQRGALLREAIDRLPEKYHRVIVMRHQEDLSYEEIATALDLPLGTVKAHIFRARALLNKFLRDQRDDL
jgi:RNA polymerase sigma-70 factor (ECF subfamily)